MALVIALVIIYIVGIARVMYKRAKCLKELRDDA